MFDRGDLVLIRDSRNRLPVVAVVDHESCEGGYDHVLVFDVQAPCHHESTHHCWVTLVGDLGDGYSVTVEVLEHAR